MCCSCLSKTTMKWLAFIICLVFLTGAVACVILAGVNYDLVFTTFSKNGFEGLGGVQLAAVIYVFGVVAFGLITFSCCTNFIFLLIVRLFLSFFSS